MLRQKSDKEIAQAAPRSLAHADSRPARSRRTGAYRPRLHGPKRYSPRREAADQALRGQPHHPRQPATPLTNTKLRERAPKLFAASGTRAEVLAKYQPSLSLKGDPTAGQLIYQAACAVCHKKGAEGRDIVPNLATILT